MSAAATIQVDSDPIKYDSDESEFANISRWDSHETGYTTSEHEDPRLSLPNNVDAYLQDLDTMAKLIEEEWPTKMEMKTGFVMIGARIATARLLSDKLDKFFSPGEGPGETCDDEVFDHLCDLAHAHRSKWTRTRRWEGPPKSPTTNRRRLRYSVHQIYESLRDSKEPDATAAATAASIREALTKARESIDYMSIAFMWKVKPPRDEESQLSGCDPVSQNRMEGLRRRYMRRIQLTTQEAPPPETNADRFWGLKAKSIIQKPEDVEYIRGQILGLSLCRDYVAVPTEADEAFCCGSLFRSC